MNRDSHQLFALFPLSEALCLLDAPQGKSRDRLNFVVFFMFLDALFVMALQPCLIWRMPTVALQRQYSAGVRGPQERWAVQGSAVVGRSARPWTMQ